MAPIFFQFDDMASAADAADTLRELGFRTKPILRVAVSGGDLTSALEILQAHGGTLAELTEPHRLHLSEQEAFASAYALDGIPLPAHTVNEDFPEAYMHPGQSVDFGQYAASILADAVSADLENSEAGGDEGRGFTDARFDPSGDDYDRISPGVSG